MAMEEVRKRLTIETASAGLDGAAAGINKVADAEARLTVESQKSERAQLSMEGAFAKLERRYVEGVRQQQELAKVQQQVNAAVAQNPALQERANAVLAGATARLNQVHSANQNVAKSTGLARHEMINLSRQAQDVGVSLASGQSPFTVLIQQGSQIADVFASSTGSVRGFFSQAIGWAARFATSTAGVVTGVTAIGAAALYMATSFSTAQREIDKVLSGLGAASGTTRGGINRIAEGAAGGGLSIGAAREAALSFAATGKIYEQNINAATNVTRELALAMGKDATEAAKMLSDALIDPAKGALELNKSIRFLDADTLKYITSLQSMGDLQGAQNALLNAAIPAIKRQAEQVDVLTRAWNLASDAVKGFLDRTSQAGARTLERVTGIEGGGFTDQERLAGARQTQQALRSTDIRGLDTGAIEAFVDALRKADAEVARLEKRMSSLTEAARFNQLSLDAREFGRSIEGTAAQIEKLTEGLAKIAQYQAARLNQGMGLDPALERQAQIGSVLLAQSIEQEQVEARKSRIFTENALNYSHVSAMSAQTLARLEDQLNVAQAQVGISAAVTELERMRAQQAAIVAQEQANINDLLRVGKDLNDATAIAAKQRAIAETEITAAIARANAEADRMLVNLQQQGQLIRANSDAERDRIKAQHTYQDLLDKGVDSIKAQAVANKQLQNAEEARARAEQEASEQAIRNIKSRADAWEAYERGLISWSVANDEAGRMVRKTAEATEEATHQAYLYSVALARARDELLRFGAAGTGAFGKAAFVPPWVQYDTLATNQQGRYTQFDPGGYNLTEKIGGGVLAADAQVNKMLAEGGTAQTAFMQLLNDNLLKSNPVNITTTAGKAGTAGTRITGGMTNELDPEKIGVLERLIQLMPEGQQIQAYQMELQKVQQTPQTLARDELIKSLTDKIAGLTQATEANTAATETITDVLSPYYSQDPRGTRLGFRAFAGGGIMTQYGELPLKKYDGGGIASSAQVAMFGEGSVPEAYVPVPSGRIPVEIRSPANSNERGQQRPIIVNVSMTANVSRDEARRTGFQIAQSMKRSLG